MSRVGKKVIEIPSGVQVTIANNIVSVKGPKGEDSLPVNPNFKIEIKEGKAQVTPVKETKDKTLRSMYGLYRSLLNARVEGVSKGFQKNLEINGVGFKAAVQGQNLQLQLGYSHDVVYPIPSGIQIKCDKPTTISVMGFNKEQVGQVAADIRAFRKPEPYQGKGIKYADEVILRKQGKKK